MVTAVARKPMKNKLWTYFEKVVQYQGNRSLSSMRNFDFKRYTPRSKKLLRASLNVRIFRRVLVQRISFLFHLTILIKLIISQYPRSRCYKVSKYLLQTSLRN